MWKTAAAAALLLPALSARTFAQDARTVVDAASNAIGAGDLKAIVYSGAAATGNYGQSRTISFGLRSIPIRNYTRAIDFTQPASRAYGDTFPTGEPGAAPPPPGTFDESVSPATPAWAQQLQIWTTPWGFLRGAAANHATVKSEKVNGTAHKVVTWMTPQKAPSGIPYKLVGYINEQNLIDRVETWVEHPVLGDEHMEFFYSNYKDFDGVKVPTYMSLKQVGMETFVAQIRDARANPTDLAEFLNAPPAPGAGGRGAGPVTAPPVASEKLADGVYRITGGYVSLAVEFRDYVVVLEGGQSEARGLAVIAETKRLFPAKRIKYVVNTHPHYDHASGLAPFAAEGITILTDDNSKYFVEAALGTPRTLVGDAFAKSHKKPKVEGVIEKMVLRDDTRTLELHHVAKLEHSDAMLIAYLPKEKILFTADFNEPPPGRPVSPSIPTLMANLDRLGIDFERHVTVHAPSPDRVLTKADLMALAKRASQEVER